jgi:hypothetical protein
MKPSEPVHDDPSVFKAMKLLPKEAKYRLLLIAGFVIAALLALGTWAYLSSARGLMSPSSNAIMVITPYWYNGTWVFDDASTGLMREPFVAGVPEMIDLLVEDIPEAKSGFRLLFSANPFPAYQKRLIWLRGDMGGNYYRLEDTSMEGWICPAMFRYYQAAPKNLYVKAEPIRR